MSDEPEVHTWHQAELLAVRWLRTHGHPSAAPAPGGRVTGVDVRSPTVLARVVHDEKAIRRDDVRRLVEAGSSVPGAELAFFTSGRYEVPALTYADVSGVLLLAYDEDGVVSGRNAAARARLTPQERAVSARSAPASRFLRYVPLVVAVYLALAAVVLVATGGEVYRAVLSALGAVVIALLWYRLGRRSRGSRTGTGGGNGDDGRAPGHVPPGGAS